MQKMYFDETIAFRENGVAHSKDVYKRQILYTETLSHKIFWCQTVEQLKLQTLELPEQQDVYKRQG